MSAQNLSGNAVHQIALMGAMGTSGDGGVSIDRLSELLPIPRPAIAAAAGRLISRDYAERLENGVYRLTLPGREALENGASLGSGVQRGWRKFPVYPDCLRQRAWKAMRLQSRFSIGDIVTLAARADETGAHDNIRRFCHLLVAAGYLAQLPTRAAGQAPSSPGHKIFRLIRDTGDIAPQHMAAKRAFRDRNTREVFPCA